MRQKSEFFYPVISLVLIVIVVFIPKTLSPSVYDDQEVERAQLALAQGSTQQSSSSPTQSVDFERNRTLFTHSIFDFEHGNYEKAQKNFEILRGRYKDLDEYVLFYLGQTFHHLGNYEQALSVFQQAVKSYPETPLLPEIKEALADTLLQTQHYREAADILRELVKIPLSDKEIFYKMGQSLEKVQDWRAEVYYKLGQSLEKAQNWKEATDAYQQLILFYPDQDVTLEAEKRIAILVREKGIPKPLLTEQMLYDGAKAAMAARAYSKAINWCQSLIAQFPQSTYLVDTSFVLAEAYSKGGKKAESLDLLNKITRDYQDENIVARGLYEIGNLQSNKEAFLKILTQYPKSAWADKAIYQLGRLGEKTGRKVEAATWYGKIREQYPDSPQAEEALWLAGWNYYQLGEYARADTQFARIIQAFWTYKDDALYWKGRSAEKQNKPEEALENYQELVKLYKESYYTVLAEMRLKTLKPDTNGPSQSIESQDADDLFTSTKWVTLLNSLKGKIDEGTHNRAAVHLPKALELSRFNLKPYAAKEVQYILTGFAPQVLSQEDLLFKYLMSRAYCEAEEYLICINLVSQIEEGMRQLQLKSFPYKLQKLKYPLAYRNEIKKYAEKNRLDPYLVAGLIKQESAYGVRSLSTSNAMGLMQIIPPTGKYIAEQVDYKGFTIDLLFEPEINISFGTWYLAYLLNRFDGNVFKAVAGYNAGPGAIERWWRDFDYLDTDEIIENIPFKETRNYVKLVLRNRALYQRLYESRWP
jgi:soluble lytic murein transglycosylase